MRFGDPECQVVLPRSSRPTSPSSCCAAAVGGRLDVDVRRRRVRHRRARAPRATRASPRTGDVITGLDVAAARRTASSSSTPAPPSTTDGTLRTAGGRVLDVTATGADRRRSAHARLRSRRRRSRGPACQYRGDIACRRDSRAQAWLVTRTVSVSPEARVRTPAMTSEHGMHRSGPPSFGRRDEAHGTPVLAALFALRDGVLVPVLRAVHHPRSTSSPDLARPRSHPNAPTGPVRTMSGS